MKMNHEFEIITEKNINFKAFINVLKYRAPHIHTEYELGLVLYGNIGLNIEDKSYYLSAGDMVFVSPFTVHELSSEMNVPMLFLQVNPSFFYGTIPMLRSINFSSSNIIKADDSYTYLHLRDLMIKFSKLFFIKDDFYELKCAGLLNLLFYEILKILPYKIVSNNDFKNHHSKAARIKRIAEYIENNYQDKITLKTLALMEHVTETHISHFFTENFHMTFQEYLMKLRCERARSLLLTTDLSLIDISISCGFSDPKYLNKTFKKLYSCMPRDYRKNLGKQKLYVQQSSMLSTQQILSDNTSLLLLDKYSRND